MKKVIIRDREGKQIDFVVTSEPEKFIDDGIKSMKWGNPDILYIDENGNYANKDSDYTIGIEDADIDSYL